jgi:hypothetical protein
LTFRAGAGRPPRTQDVPVYLDAVGSVRALNNVVVRARSTAN